MPLKQKASISNSRQQISQKFPKSKGKQQALTKINAALLNALPAPIALVDRKGIILSVNEAWRRFASPIVLKGKKVGAGSHYLQVFERAYRTYSEEVRKVSEGFRAVLSGTKKDFVFEYPCHTPTEQHWSRVMITPITETKAGGAVVMHLDATDSRKADHAVREGRERIEGIIRSAMDAIITVDHNQRIVMFNPAAELMFGCKTREVLGKSLGQLIPQKFRKAHHRYIREFGQTGITPRAMGRLGRVYGLRANGEEFPIEASISRVGVGKRKLYTVILRDITTRVKAEEDLRRSEERLDLALRGANLGTWDWNVQTGTVHRNKRWAEMIGYTLDELKPNFRTFEKLLHPDDKSLVLETLQSHLNGRTSFYQAEFRLRTKSRNWKWILDRGKVVSRNAEGRPLRATGTHLDITERKEAEQALSKERKFINAVLETAGALVMVLDWQGRVVRFNRACEKLSGYFFEEIRGKPIWDTILLSEEANAVKHGFRSLRRGNTSNHFETHWVTKKKKQRLISWSNVGLFNDKGKLDYVVGTGLDITENRNAEKAINRLLRQNELILQSAGEGIYGIDVHGKATFFNRTAEKLTGWKWKGIRGQVLHFLIHHSKPDGTPYPREECPIYSSLTGGSVHQVGTEVFWRKDGTNFPAEYTSTPIHGANKTIEGAVVTFKDITDRRKSEEALRESEERFKAFMNHSPAVAFLKDEQGRYIYVNQSIESVLNKPCEEWLGKTDQQLFPLKVARSLRKHDLEALKKGGVLEIEESTINDHGTVRHWLVFKFPVHRTQDLRYIGGVALDITSRRQIEQTLRERELELQQSQKELQALGGQLISAQEEERRRISRELHDDMNQRLAVLALNIQSEQQQLVESDRMFTTLQNLYDQVSSLSDDVRHLAYQLHPSILDDLGLEVALQSFVNDFSKWEGIRVTLTSSQVPRALPQEVASCLYRITQEGLRNVARHAQASTVELTLTFQEDAIKLCIKDNGKGFDVDTLRSGKKGLGLIGMQERVRLIHGTLTFESHSGKGTEVCAFIPLHQKTRGDRRDNQFSG